MIMIMIMIIMMIAITNHVSPPAGCEPADFLALMDPPALDAEAERVNARRASITGAGQGGGEWNGPLRHLFPVVCRL